ncbi:hypothetical protein RJZ56_007428 [Blastomyces dermatitidis]
MVGIALLGAGIFAREAHVPAILKNAAAKVLAVYSRSENSANSVVEALNNTTTPIDVYSDEKPGHGLDELLQRPDIEAVIVLLPILVLPAVVRKCLAAGKHVLAEKPIAKDIATGRALITDEVVASGTIGELHHVHARVATSMAPENKYFQTAWRAEPGYQGGFVLDAGVHFVALVRMVAGQEIVETKSFTAQFAPHLRPLDTVNAALRFSKGAQGTLSISFAAATYIADFVFIGTAGVLTVKCAGVDTTVRVEGGDRNVVSEEVFPADGNVNEIRAFVQAIAAGKGDRAGSPREALADVAVIESVCAGGGLVQSHEI